MDVSILPVCVVAKQELRVLPAIQTRDLAEGSLHGSGQAFTLAISPVRTLNMRGLDLATMMDDGSGRVDERLIAMISICAIKIRS